MAETLETISSVTIKQSISNVELITPADVSPTEWKVRFTFEDVTYDNNNTIINRKQGSRIVERTFGKIASDDLGNGLTPTILAGGIKTAGYKYRLEDINYVPTPGINTDE